MLCRSGVQPGQPFINSFDSERDDLLVSPPVFVQYCSILYFHTTQRDTCVSGARAVAYHARATTACAVMSCTGSAENLASHAL